MKEITRIHIAKLTYDIEVAAKKELEKYIAALERYAEDQEILDDIEIRITELLAERGVEKGGVITTSDVAAVRAQLGEPSDFAPEGASGSVADTEQLDTEGKRVYRDTDNAILGGVLAGFARFFGIDSLWVRLIFIVLLFASFGAALIVYMVLWLIIPPARTAAQKLQMQGKPVTLEAIKAMAGDDEKRSEAAQTTRRIVRNIVGIFLVISAIGALAATITAINLMLFGTVGDTPAVHWWPHETWWVLTAFILFVLAGLLLSALCLVLAYAVFRRVWNKRTGTAVAAIVAAGLISFASGVSLVLYGGMEEQARIQAERRMTSVELPADFAGVKSLTVTTDDKLKGIAYVEYIVSDKPRYELEALPGVKPQFEVAKGDTSATLTLTTTDDNTWRPWGYMGGPLLKIYGPALETIVVESSQTHYYSKSPQDKLHITVRGDSFSLAGSYTTVQVDSEADVTLKDATIENLEANLTGGKVTAGVVRTLNVTRPEACPANDDTDENKVVVQAVSSGTMLYNKDKRPAATTKHECGTVVIGSNSEYDKGEE